MLHTHTAVAVTVASCVRGERLPATAEALAQARPEVDLEMVREVFHEAATLLHKGLALDGLGVKSTCA